MLTINNYDFFFSPKIIDKGKEDFENGKISNFIKKGEGLYSAGAGISRCDIKIEKSGIITGLTCSCAYASTGRRCRHMYALLMYMKSVYQEEIAQESSIGINSLIQVYYRRFEHINSEKAQIIPELFFRDGALLFRLKIGNEKFYVVNNIETLYNAFEHEEEKKYGKNFSFVHRYSNIDERSRRFMELALSIYYDYRDDAESDYRYYYRKRNSPKEFELLGYHLETFLDIYGSEPLIISGGRYEIKNEEPPLGLHLNSTNAGRIKITASELPVYLGRSKKSFFIMPKKQTLYLANTEFSLCVEPLLDCFYRENNNLLYISKDKVGAFYNSVIKQLEKWVDIVDDGVDENLIPPQLTAEIYIDVTDDDIICAQLKFNYGDKVYDSSYDNSKNAFCDRLGEKVCLDVVEKYFNYNENDRVHPYFIDSDDTAFDFITTGLSSLSELMAVYVSDRFKRINVRKPAKPAVGISVSGGLLEMDISALGYTLEELAELLKAYRQGRKYHRFKDGSFALTDDSIGDIDSLAKEMNITDKALLKGKLSVPMYRMLYLDSIQKDHQSLRLKRSADFRNIVSEYNSIVGDDSSFPIPESLDTVMRDYQKYGYNWMCTLGKYHMGGILADDMGLGKTLQSIALMLHIKQSAKEGDKKQSLVVCPSSLTLNWQNEIEKFAPELKTVCLNGVVAERRKLFESLDDYDVVITSYATLIRDIDKYDDLNFAVQIIDEAQNIKNHNTQSAKAVKAINSELCFALTGTPIENTLAELWSIFDFIMPGYLHNYAYFKRNYETPIVRNGDEKTIASLQHLTSPFILRRLKKDVLTELPDKTETVLITEFDSEQKKLYTANAAQIKGELKGLNEKSDRIKILAMLTRLRQICCDPSLVYDNYTGGSAKLDQCIELVKSCVEAGHKILLFSQFTTMLDIIEKRLGEENISSYMLTGKTKSRDRIKLVSEFNENDVSVFLISLKAGGTGLNLTGADIVIHYDPWWNLSAENQASDRVYRIGQKNNVQIYKLISKGTIEEKIRELQKRKADLLETAIGGDGDILNMTAEEVIGLLE